LVRSSHELEETNASRGARGFDDLDTHWAEHETLPDWGLTVSDRCELVDDIDAVVESHSERYFHLPDECSICGSDVEKRGPSHYCTGGLSCPARLKRSGEHFASDDGLEIEGIGSTMAGQVRNSFETERTRDIIERLPGRGVDPERTQAESGDEPTALTSMFIT